MGLYSAIWVSKGYVGFRVRGGLEKKIKMEATMSNLPPLIKTPIEKWLSKFRVWRLQVNCNPPTISPHPPPRVSSGFRA